MRIKYVVVFLTILSIISSNAMALQKQPYKGYEYNPLDALRAVPAPVGYIPTRSISATDWGTTPLLTPEDMIVGKDGNIYVLDSGNSRIVILDYNLKFVGEITTLIGENGEEKLNKPTGIALSKSGLIYVADTENFRVVAFDKDGNIKRILKKPKSELYPNQVEFKPKKVVVDSSDNVYILVTGIYQGAILYTSMDRFEGYYASERVKATLSVLSDYFWKQFMSQEQIAGMKRYVPTEYTNFTIDENDFITSVTQDKTNVDTIRRLNPAGKNILETGIQYGDYEKIYYDGKDLSTQFVDVAVDNDGFVSALDLTRGRVFQYDKEMTFLYSFGGLGKQLGTFAFPVAIENVKDKIIVLDKDKASITEFALTEYGEKIKAAVMLYNKGYYNEAIEPWKEVLRENGNNQFAYIGLSKAALNLGQYADAMKYAKLGYSPKTYAKALKGYRVEFVRNNFGYIMSITLLLIGFLTYNGIRKKRKNKRRSG